MRFFLALVAMNIKSALSLRLAFLIEMLFMLGNNLIFLFIWWVFFLNFREVGGWGFNDMVLMMAIVRLGYGASRVFFGGIKYLSERITGGGLDTFLTQPKNTLLYALASESQSKGWGHIISALVLFAFTGGTPTLYLLSLLGAVCVCLVFTASGLMAHALCFWFGDLSEVCKTYTDSIFLFVHYPMNIYKGFVQVLMFTLFPAGVIGYLPVELVKYPSLANGLTLLFATAIFTGLAIITFYRGLKRYESGNLFI